MAALSLILSIVAVIVAVAAFLFARGGLAAGRGPAAPPVAVDYTISGAVKVTNDCDGQIASIPDRVTVETELQNQPANIAVPGRTTINLAPDPAAGPNPIKIGTYSITVRWLPGTTVAPAR